MKHFIWFSLFFFSLTACNQVDPQKIAAQTERAKEFLGRMSLDTASMIIDSVLLQAPKNVDALLIKGKVLSLSEEHEKAITVFDNLIKENPNVAGPYHERSIANLNAKKINEAEADIAKALSIIPNSGPLRMQKAMIHQRKEEHGDAIKIFDDLIAKDSMNERLIFLRALSKKWSKDLDGAIEDINRCLKLNVDNPFELFEQRAFLHKEKGWNIEALEDMGMMISMARIADVDEIICAARNSRAELFIEMDQTEKALYDLNLAIPLDTLNPYGLVLRAGLLIKHNQMDRACADLDLALKRNYTKLYGPKALNLQNLHCQN